MKTRIIHTKIWKDEFFAELTPSEKLLFIYYITNERVNIIHCYEITDREVVFDTGIDRGMIQAFKEKAARGNKLFFNGNHVFLVNAAKYETYTGPRNEDAKQTLIGQMPDEIKAWFLNLKDTPIPTPIHTPFKGNISKKPEIKEGVLGETNTNTPLTRKSPEYLLHIPPEDMDSLREGYEVTASQVQSRAEGIHNWYLSNIRKNRRDDYKAVLRNAIKKDYPEKERRMIINAKTIGNYQNY